MPSMTASTSAAPDPTAEPTRRERNRARRHGAIEAAALELFSEQGYENTTVEEIAGRADVSLRTFFRYFATKDQTVLSDLPPTDGELRRQLLEHPPTPDVWTLLHSTYCEIAQHHTLDALRRIKARYRLIHSTPALLARHAEYNRLEQQEVVRVLLERGAGLDEDELTLIVAVAYTTIWHAVERWASEATTAPLADELDRAFRSLPIALGARELHGDGYLAPDEAYKNERAS
jgi:AcrR family transcriptional regulator